MLRSTNNEGDAGSKRRSRSGSRGRREEKVWSQLPWRSIENPHPPMKILSDDAVEAIHNTSLDVLENIGMDFLHAEALEVLKAGGADVDGSTNRVRFDKGLITDLVAKAPSHFRVYARNPDHTLSIGGNSVAFGSVSGPPNSSDLDNGRRRGSFEDFSNFVRLTQSLNIIQFFSGYPVEPLDRPPETRHLDCISAFVSLTDKVPHCYSLGRVRIKDALEITRIARGIDYETMAREPSMLSVVNTSSPLRYDGPMIEGSIEMARHGQPVGVTPFTLSGAMAPVTLPGALAQQNAEALAVIAMIQMVNPGNPVIYGGFTSNVDMKTGSPAFGTPEFLKATVAGGQMARRYGLPYRGSNVNASNCVDAQASYESVWSIVGAMLGGVNLLMHGAGWLEGGLCASFEKFVLDAELLQQASEIMTPMLVDKETLGYDAIQDVGPGGHFFGTQHTLDRYETAFYAPFLSDWQNFENWEDSGRLDATARANIIYKAILSDYEEPKLPDNRREEMEAFVARRKEEGGAPPF